MSGTPADGRSPRATATTRAGGRTKAGRVRTDGPLRIVRLANFVAPASGGLRTALRELGKGYRAAGHEPVLVVPGERESDRETEQGRVITLPGPLLPGTGGYRVLTGRARVAALLQELAPDRLEVSDRTTLRWTGTWARRARVPAVMVSHETADGVLRTWGLPEAAARRAADALNTRTAHTYARVVCTTEFAEREFVRIGARNVVRAPLGVDLVERHPALRDPALRSRYADATQPLLVMCSRLSLEKRPDTALDALETLRRRGRRAVLVVVMTDRCGRGSNGTRGNAACRDLPGPCPRPRVPRRAPGHRRRVPGAWARRDLRAGRAGGDGVRHARRGERVVGPAGGDRRLGRGRGGPGRRIRRAAELLLERPWLTRREAARARAECFGWDASVAAFLAAHDAPGSP